MRETGTALSAAKTKIAFTQYGLVQRPRKHTGPPLYNHYSLLATIEKTWNLAPLTSKDAGVSPMMEFFQDGSMSSTQSTSTPNQWNSWLEVFLIAVSVAIALVITAWSSCICVENKTI